MKQYSKPVVSIDNGLAEGVYAASGAGCYEASASIQQTPQTGRGDYRIQVNGHHNADHTKESQVLTISFNQNVTYCIRWSRTEFRRWNSDTDNQTELSSESN